MKFIDKKISDTYFQIYILIDSKEKKNIINLVKNDLLVFEKEQLQEQMNLYKSISKNTNSEQSLGKYNKIKKDLDNLNINNVSFNKEDLENGLCDHILKDIIMHLEELDIIQVLVQDTSIIGSFTDNNPLTVVYSFCYIPKDIKIKYPIQKGNAYLFTTKDIDMIQTEMLIANKLYKKHKVIYSTEFSDLLFSYMCEDDMRFDLYMDISEIESKFQIDRNELVGLQRNKYLLKNKDNQNCIISIKEIYDKDVYDITDEIVKKIYYLNTKTVKELRNKIDDVFSFIYNINSNVMSILQNMAKINNFKIDNYVTEHYKKIMEVDEITDQIYEDIKISYITSYIFATSDITIDEYFFYLEQEYKLLYQVKKPEDEMTFDEYVNMKAPYYALYEFFRQKNLVTERSYNE